MQFMTAFLRLKINLHLSTPLSERGGGENRCSKAVELEICPINVTGEQAEKEHKTSCTAREGRVMEPLCVTTTTRIKIGNNFM